MITKKLWYWQGMNHDGLPGEGTRWAENRLLLMQELEQHQIIPLRVKSLRVKRALWRNDKSTEVIHLLATLLKAGLTLSEGLELLAGQQPSKQWQALLGSLANELEHGTPLSSALAQWPDVFPPLYQAMIRTGELTGKLDECCFELARQQKAQRQLTDKVKKALRYPIIILTMAIMVVVAMLQFVLPEFAAIYRTFNTPLPALTQGDHRVCRLESTLGWADCPDDRHANCSQQPAEPKARLANAAPARITPHARNGPVDQRSEAHTNFYHPRADADGGDRFFTRA